jgi:predicted phosphodiesterase
MKPSDLAKEYRRKWPQMPTLALARILYKENLAMFKDVEAARYALRYVEGKAGPGKLRKTITSSDLYMTKERPRNPYNLPESEEKEYLPYVIQGKRIAVLSDIHVPYHSIAALTAALQFIEKEKPDVIYLNGDFFDFHKISKYATDPRKRSLAHELEAGRQLLNILQKFNARIVFKIGNHDARYQHYLMQKAPELLGLPEFELQNLLSFRERGIDLVESMQIAKAGSLNIIHGHEFVQSVFNPVNTARGLFLRAKTSALQGHNHQVSEHTEPDMNGNITTTWSVGCLSELHPEYMPLNRWAHGFAMVDVDGKDFQVRNYRIYNGKII